MKARHLVALIVIPLIAATTGALGWIIGADIGGNSESGFTYQGLPGYEGSGALGGHIGIVLGVLIGISLWKWYCKKM